MSYNILFKNDLWFPTQPKLLPRPTKNCVHCGMLIKSLNCWIFHVIRAKVLISLLSGAYQIASAGLSHRQNTFLLQKRRISYMLTQVLLFGAHPISAQVTENVSFAVSASSLSKNSDTICESLSDCHILLSRLFNTRLKSFLYFLSWLSKLKSC